MDRQQLWETVKDSDKIIYGRNGWALTSLGYGLGDLRQIIIRLNPGRVPYRHDKLIATGGTSMHAAYTFGLNSSPSFFQLEACQLAMAY